MIHAGNLPAELTSFVGRGGEVASLTRLLSTARLVTLTGVGKTRLSLRAATNLRPAFPDGAWFAEVTDPALVALTVADALDVRDISTRTPINVLTEFLRDRRLLLILDNAEHLLDGLVDKSVLTVEQQQDGVRYRLLETMRHCGPAPAA